MKKQTKFSITFFLLLLSQLSFGMKNQTEREKIPTLFSPAPTELENPLGKEKPLSCWQKTKKCWDNFNFSYALEDSVSDWADYFTNQKELAALLQKAKALHQEKPESLQVFLEETKNDAQWYSDEIQDFEKKWKNSLKIVGRLKKALPVVCCPIQVCCIGCICAGMKCCPKQCNGLLQTIAKQQGGLIK